MGFKILLVFLVCSLPSIAIAADQYYIGSRDGVDALQQPHRDAGVVGHLKRLTDVKVIQKKRAWWKVGTLNVSPKVTGWIPSGAVRKRYQRTAIQKSSHSFFSSFSSFFHHNDAGNRKTAVLGVRGLDDEGNAAEAKANIAGVQWMEKLAVPDNDIAAFVEQGGLNP